jgi:hypothetical protein
MAGISRVNGGVVAPATLHGGYPMLFLKVAGSGATFAADTGGSGAAITEGNFTKAIRAIQRVATIVYIGARADAQFVVAVDSSTAQTSNYPGNVDATPTVTERLKAELEADISGLTATVTDISNLTAGQLA